MSSVAEIVRAAQERDHWEGLLQFSTWEKAVGGPDPHMAVAGYLGRDVPRTERVWRGLVYLGFYNVPTAEVVWREWPVWRALKEPEGLLPWIEEHWTGFAFRRERRPVRTRLKLDRYLQAAAVWADEAWELPWMQEPGSYEDAWRDIQDIPYLGRYIALKALEFLTRYCGAQIALEDMRARGGWSPRTALALLHPNFAPLLMGNDDAPNLKAADSLFEFTQSTLAERGLTLSNYELQVLLCDYKQCYMGQRQFPGRSQDSEMAYAYKIRGHWPEHEFQMWEARKILFPHEALGELNGWTGVREELGSFYRQTGRMWSDLLYDYPSTGSLPIERAA